MKEMLVKVSNIEGEEIRGIYSHLSSLKELEYLINPDHGEVYDRYIKDLNDTNNAYQSWWEKITLKYHLPVNDNRKWEFNFRTNKIYLL